MPVMKYHVPEFRETVIHLPPEYHNWSPRRQKNQESLLGVCIYAAYAYALYRYGLIARCFFAPCAFVGTVVCMMYSAYKEKQHKQTCKQCSS